MSMPRDAPPADLPSIPVRIRPAATVVLLRDTARGLQVFLLSRVDGLPFAAGMAVFPGGAVDPADSDPIADWAGPPPEEFARIFDVPHGGALLSAATRELFEESGVLLASGPGQRPAPAVLPADVRRQSDRGLLSWPALLAERGLVLRADLLHPWARWITPPGGTRRYDTCFLLAELPPGQIADGDTSEATGGFWIRPSDALAAVQAGDLSLMHPTQAVLRSLLDIPSAAAAMRTPSPLLAPSPDPQNLRTEFDPGEGVTDRTVAAVSASQLTRRRLASNPGPMTLDGTNSYLIAAPGSPTSVVVDPGPLDPGHLAALAERPVELVLLTHHHLDHTESAHAFAALTGAPVRAIDPALCIDGDALRDGETIAAAGTQIRVLATPGHTADSVCFVLPDDEVGRGSVLTGDTILGRGTTILAHPDGRLADYLASLERLRALGPATVLPAHGPVRRDIAAVAAEYAAHRRERLDQIRAALATAGADADVPTVTDLVYLDIDPSVRAAAERSVAAQLEYLRGS